MNAVLSWVWTVALCLGFPIALLICEYGGLRSVLWNMWVRLCSWRAWKNGILSLLETTLRFFIGFVVLWVVFECVKTLLAKGSGDDFRGWGN